MPLIPRHRRRLPVRVRDAEQARAQANSRVTRPRIWTGATGGKKLLSRHEHRGGTHAPGMILPAKREIRNVDDVRAARVAHQIKQETRRYPVIERKPRSVLQPAIDLDRINELHHTATTAALAATLDDEFLERRNRIRRTPRVLGVQVPTSDHHLRFPGGHNPAVLQEHKALMRLPMVDETVALPDARGPATTVVAAPVAPRSLMKDHTAERLQVGQEGPMGGIRGPQHTPAAGLHHMASWEVDGAATVAPSVGVWHENAPGSRAVTDEPELLFLHEGTSTVVPSAPWAHAVGDLPAAAARALLVQHEPPSYAPAPQSAPSGPWEARLRAEPALSSMRGSLAPVREHLDPGAVPVSAAASRSLQLQHLDDTSRWHSVPTQVDAMVNVQSQQPHRVGLLAAEAMGPLGPVPVSEQGKAAVHRWRSAAEDRLVPLRNALTGSGVAVDVGVGVGDLSMSGARVPTQAAMLTAHDGTQRWGVPDASLMSSAQTRQDPEHGVRRVMTLGEPPLIGSFAPVEQSVDMEGGATAWTMARSQALLPTHPLRASPNLMPDPSESGLLLEVHRARPMASQRLIGTATQDEAMDAFFDSTADALAQHWPDADVGHRLLTSLPPPVDSEFAPHVDAHPDVAAHQAMFAHVTQPRMLHGTAGGRHSPGVNGRNEVWEPVHQPSSPPLLPDQEDVRGSVRSPFRRQRYERPNRHLLRLPTKRTPRNGL